MSLPLAKIARIAKKVRLSPRARQRGSLVIEMLVVVPLFAMLMGFAFWFYQVHMAQMAVYRHVREPVWTTATFACGNAGDTGASYGGSQGGASVAGGGSITVSGADFSKVYQNVPGGPNNEVINRSTSTGKKDDTVTVDGADVPGILAIRTSHYQASATMMCNETVHDGQPDPMKRSAAMAVDP